MNGTMTTAGGQRDDRAELRELSLSEERFRLLVDSVMDYAIFMLDDEGHVQSWNSGAERLKGYTQSEIVGRHYSTFYTPEDRERRIPEHMLATARREGRAETSGWRVRKDGTRFWANVVMTALWNEDGSPAGFAKVTRDMTEQYRTREARENLLVQQQQTLERLEEVDRWRKDFIAAIAHDLRSPVSAIIGFAEFVEDGEVLEQKQLLRIIERILSNAYAIDAMIDHLRTDAMLEAGAITLNLEEIPLAPLVDAVMADMEMALRDHDVTSDIDTATVRADRRGLERILRNLIGNAARHTPPGTAITVRNRRQNGHVVVEVEDGGGGIDPEQVDHVFDRFHRRKGGGSGLGLSIVKQYVELHGGEVGVHTEAGVGSTFHFTLPD